MQTNFSAEQLENPAIAASEQILRKCVHCGFCTATCPTYVLLGDELDSPRGRIYLIKDMLEHGRPATPEVVKHLDRCLSCLACMTTCPSGVHYQHLIDHARVHVEQTYRRPAADRLLRRLLAAVLPHPRRFRLALRLARIAKPLAAVLPLRLRAMLRLAPAGLPPRAGAADPAQRPDPSASGAARAQRRRVGVLTGCVQSVLAPDIHAATVRLLERAGVDCVAIGGCCAAISHHLGREIDAREMAGALLASVGRAEGIDAIVANASGCGTQLKDYGFIYRDDAELAASAAAAAGMTRDVTELLAEVGLPPVTHRPGLRVAYHSACSMQHGQGVDRLPRELLAQAGFELAEIGEGHLCCGSAGTYNLLQPEIAGRLRERKLGHIARTGADVVATGNVGCMTQLAGAAAPVVHTVELLDWATGGPAPAALA